MEISLLFSHHNSTSFFCMNDAHDNFWSSRQSINKNIISIAEIYSWAYVGSPAFSLKVCGTYRLISHKYLAPLVDCKLLARLVVTILCIIAWNDSHIRFVVGSILASRAAASVRITKPSRGGLSSPLPLPLIRGPLLPPCHLGNMFLKPTYSFP